MATASLLPLPRAVFYDAIGNPLSGGFVATYVPGGTTPKLTWQDAAETTPNANPIVLDAAGSCLLYGSGNYQITVTDALGNQVPGYSGLSSDVAVSAGISAAMQPVVSAPTVAQAAALLGVVSDDVIPTLASFGAIGNGSTNDTAAVQAAQAGPTWTFAEAGTFRTTIASSAFNGAFWGTGQIIDSADNQRGKFFSVIQAAPPSLNNPASIETAFNGDWSRQTFAIEHRIYGAATLGQPATGYLYTDNAYPFVGYMLNTSGWNESTTENTGRTAAVFSRVSATNSGQGDFIVYNAEVTITSTKPGATSWLANPAGSIIAGDVAAEVDGCYLNPFEQNLVDNGHDVAGIGLVNNFFRTNGTQALGESWIGYRPQSLGTQPVDAGVSLAGPFKWGIDFTTGTYSNNQAIGLAASQRIYFNASNTGGFPNGTVNGSAYISYNAGTSTLGMVNGSELLAVSTSAVSTNAPTSFGGNITPTSDNLYVCGASGQRWTAVWAVNGAIQTSDPRLKTDIKPLTGAMEILRKITPVTYQWIVGGQDEVGVAEDQQVQATETVTGTAREIQVVDGKATLVETETTSEVLLFDEMLVFDQAGAPVMVNAAPKGKPPRMVQAIHRVPRMVTKPVTVKRRVDRPGKRTHWGFLASDIKAATPEGMDWGAYVLGEDGTEHIRPDQLIPVLWKAIQELSDEIAALKAKN